MLSDKARKLGEEPAFPYAVREDTEAWSGGMTKREYFAALAMQGLIASVPTESKMIDSDRSRMDYPKDTPKETVLAGHAVRCADALLEQLVKEEI